MRPTERPSRSAADTPTVAAAEPVGAPHLPAEQLAQLAQDLKVWSAELGFQELRITDTDLRKHPEHFRRWLARGFQGDMGYLERNVEKRENPALLHPGTARILSVRMDYLPAEAVEPQAVLGDPTLGYIARYAMGRDYHKVMRRRLATLAKRIEAATLAAGHRAFVDTAPVLEKALGERAGHGWIGKNTLLLHRNAGSWFFLGEVFTTLNLPIDAPQETEHCGTCQACIDVCPTQAIVGPRQLDARRCIAWLTIENKGPIPEELRRPMGNRIFGCDDCQLVCPWNRDAPQTIEPDFAVRNRLDAPDLVELFRWSEAQFLERTEGMAVRRVSWPQWQRNVAVALGNAPGSVEAVDELNRGREAAGEMVREHIDWALEQQRQSLVAAAEPG